MSRSAYAVRDGAAHMGRFYAHHERWDGTGYPRGLKGEDIPLGARMVAMANTLDVIMSDEPYAAAQPFSGAREEIVRESARQLDPQVVKAFLTIPESIWHAPHNEIEPHNYRFTPWKR